MKDEYVIKKYHHRVWWIIDFNQVIPGFVDVRSWNDFAKTISADWAGMKIEKLWRYLMYRELWCPRGSVDLYFCYRKNLEHKFD